MRKIEIPGQTESSALVIKALSRLSSGGAPRAYSIEDRIGGYYQGIKFQDGNPKTVGINGLTIEALLAISIDRLDKLQCGPFACDENREAIEHLGKACLALSRRQESRESRGVLGDPVV